MGLRQRLSLAVAVLHEPQILILDEPTSGVDPVARDSFWELLIALSREQSVTIFVTTHFMNEGMRCDRISLMNAGKVLACDAPQKLIEKRGAANLEEAFIAYMEDAIAAAKPGDGKTNGKEVAPGAGRPTPTPTPAPTPTPTRSGLSVRLGRMRAYAHNETMQILRDPVRLDVRVRRVGAADAGLRLRHHHRRRAHPLRRARSRSVAREPHVPRAVRGLAPLLHQDRAGAFGGRGACGGCNPTTSRSSSRSRRASASTFAAAPSPEVMAQVDGAMTFRGDTVAQYVRGRARGHAQGPRDRPGDRATRSPTRPTSRSASSTTRRSRASTRSCPASPRCCCC